jgi:hypothetical protein
MIRWLLDAQQSQLAFAFGIIFVAVLAVKFEAMLLVVALVVALTLLENKPLALDFICVALES